MYSDKHTIFRSPNEQLTIDEELDGLQVRLSNFGKALAELSIEHIKASTPQAKGRIERLWETLQDRLPVEMRLLGIKNIEEANRALGKLLERHNRQYQVPAAESSDAHRPLAEGVNLEYVFSKREMRKIGSCSEFSYNNRIYAPVGNGCCFQARTAVEVRETFKGEVIVWHKGQFVKFREIERVQRTQVPAVEKTEKTKKSYKPAANHPWRVNPVRGKQNERNSSNTVA